jgi:hypothetical protein
MAVLTGNDNEVDYQGLGFVDAADGFTDMRIWKKWEGSNAARAAILVLGIADTMARKGQDQYELGTQGWIVKVQRSAFCIVCNRKLTAPESISSGIGPMCAGRKS